MTEQLAALLIERQFPELAPARVGLYGEGWDNTAYRVNDDLLFRFPRRQQAVPLMETECRVLPRVAPRLPLPVPIPLYQGAASDLYPWPFAGYRHLPGWMLCGAGLSEKDRFRIAAPLGEFLRALHTIPVDECRTFGAGPDPIGRLEFGRRMPRIRALLRKHAALLPWSATVAEELSAALPPEYSPGSNALCHGDLYCRHLLVDDSGNLNGVIDWGDVHIGDRAADLMVAYTLFPAAARRRFFEVYGDVDETTAHIARCRALFHCLYVLDYAREIADEDLLQETWTALRNVGADIPGP